MTDPAPTSNGGRDEPDEGSGEARADAEPSVLSSLPRTRPGVRSPRRDPRPAAGTRASTGRRRPAGGQEPAPEPGPDEEQAGATGLESIALDGVRAATEAAGAGIRIGRWAAGALRDAVRRD